MSSLGLGKTLFNSSVCFLGNARDAEIVLTERLSRSKASGAWPIEALDYVSKRYDLTNLPILENRDLEDPLQVEKILNSIFPFFESLEQQNLIRFTRAKNNAIRFITHHYAHACAGAFMSPFENALILVIDGAGSRAEAFDSENIERKFFDFTSSSNQSAEERSVYSLRGGNLRCLEKKWQTFYKSTAHADHFFSSGLGTFYEKSSELIFNSKTSAGKVMGLASYGKPNEIISIENYLESLDWSKRFSGGSKNDWEKSQHLSFYQNTAADVQSYFENELISYAENLKQKYPDFDNLILMGGCSLNCTTNMKIFDKKIFGNVYIPPFPGDESIGLGAAYAQNLLGETTHWSPFKFEEQHGYFGPKGSIPNEDSVLKHFKDFNIHRPASICEYAAEKLANKKIIAWFQGRSESGPRALGNRSILASPFHEGIKNTLNTEIKFRESFRPYGCSALHEKSHTLFSVPQGFNNPYMSFAVKVRETHKQALKEVTHVDGSSRMQTVRRSQNRLFYDLIEMFGEKTGLHCLLNTSLNIMGEPIVETLADARKFLLHVPVDGLVVDNFYITKK